MRKDIIATAFAASVAATWAAQASDTFVAPAPLTPSLQEMKQYCMNVKQQTGSLVDWHGYCEVSQDEGKTWRSMSSLEIAMLVVAVGGVGLLIRNRKKKSEGDLSVLEPLRVSSSLKWGSVNNPSIVDVGDSDSVATLGVTLVAEEVSPIQSAPNTDPAAAIASLVVEPVSDAEPLPAVLRYRRAGGSMAPDGPGVVLPVAPAWSTGIWEMKPEKTPTADELFIPDFLRRRDTPEALLATEASSPPVAIAVPEAGATQMVDEGSRPSEAVVWSAGATETVDIPSWISQGKYDDLSRFIRGREYVTTSLIKMQLPINTTDDRANEILKHFVTKGVLKVSETQAGGNGTNIRYDRIA